MKKFKNHQRPRRKYRFDIVGHKKALKIWWDSPFNTGFDLNYKYLIVIIPFPLSLHPKLYFNKGFKVVVHVFTVFKEYETEKIWLMDL